MIRLFEFCLHFLTLYISGKFNTFLKIWQLRCSQVKIWFGNRIRIWPFVFESVKLSRFFTLHWSCAMWQESQYRYVNPFINIWRITKLPILYASLVVFGFCFCDEVLNYSCEDYTNPIGKCKVRKPFTSDLWLCFIPNNNNKHSWYWNICNFNV